MMRGKSASIFSSVWRRCSEDEDALKSLDLARVGRISSTEGGTRNYFFLGEMWISFRYVLQYRDDWAKNLGH